MYVKHHVPQRMTRSQTQNNDCDIELPSLRQDLTCEGSDQFISPVKVCDPINIPECEQLNNTPVCSTPMTSTHNMDSSVPSDSDTLSDSEENNEHDEHKYDHEGSYLENKSVDEVDMDDPYGYYNYTLLFCTLS